MKSMREERGEGPAVTSFAAFYEDNRTAAIRLVWLLTHDSAVAEDIVQDAFTTMFLRFDAADAFGAIDDPRAYLRRVIVNGVYQRTRRRGREARRLEVVGRAQPRSAEDQSEGLAGGLATAIHRLPLDQRTAIVLRYWGDLDHRAIADAMGVRPGTARSLLSRATTQLRKDYTP